MLVHEEGEAARSSVDSRETTREFQGCGRERAPAAALSVSAARLWYLGSCPPQTLAHCPPACPSALALNPLRPSGCSEPFSYELGCRCQWSAHRAHRSWQMSCWSQGILLQRCVSGGPFPRGGMEEPVVLLENLTVNLVGDAASYINILSDSM